MKKDRIEIIKKLLLKYIPDDHKAEEFANGIENGKCLGIGIKRAPDLCEKNLIDNFAKIGIPVKMIRLKYYSKFEAVIYINQTAP